MFRQTVPWITALALAFVMSGSAAAADGNGNVIEDASFDLESGAGLATTDDDSGERVHARFTGGGSAEVSADGVSLVLDTLTQTDGDRTLTVTPGGDFQRLGRSRVFVGHGTAAVELEGVTTSFEDVRIMVKLRGRGDRLRLIGKVRGKNGPHTGDGQLVPPDILKGVFRGQRVEPEPEPEPNAE